MQTTLHTMFLAEGFLVFTLLMELQIFITKRTPFVDYTDCKNIFKYKIASEVHTSPHMSRCHSMTHP